MEQMKGLRDQWDRVAGWAAITLGAVLLLLGWLGVSRYALAPSQLPYVVSGGLGGLFLLGVGATLLLSADLQDEWRKLDDIERKLDRLAVLETVVEEPSDADRVAGNGSHRGRVAAGSGRRAAGAAAR